MRILFGTAKEEGFMNSFMIEQVDAIYFYAQPLDRS